MLLLELLAQRGDLLADVACGPGCAERVVLVRDGHAERGHDGVSRVLLDSASVARQRGRRRLEVALENPPERLRVERPGKRHRIDDVGEQDRHEAPELHRGRRRRRRGEEQRLVLAENRGLELPERRPGVDAELVHERLARRPVRRQSVGLPPRAIQREHELRARPLAKRVRDDERLQLGDELRVPPECEVGLDSRLERGQAKLLEARDLVLRERLVGEVRQRDSSPERQRLAERHLGARRVACIERRSALRGKPGEPMDVHPLRVDLEHVAGRARLDHPGSERLPKLRHVLLDGMRRRCGRARGPELLDEAISRDDPPGLEREQGEQRLLLRAADGDGSTSTRDVNGPEQPQLELRVACPARAAHGSPRLVAPGSFSPAARLVHAPA